MKDDALVILVERGCCLPSGLRGNRAPVRRCADGAIDWMEHLFALGNRLFAQDAATGSLPMLYAATAPDVHGGDYIGPDAFAELWAIR